MKSKLHSYTRTFLFLVAISQVSENHAWPWSADDATTEIEMGAESELSGNGNTEDVFEEEEDESMDPEQSLRCAQTFHKNLQTILRNIMPENSTYRTMAERVARQVVGEETDHDELVQSMLDLEPSNIIVPFFKIIGSALANNATAIDENYKSLPYAVRWQVSDLIKFAVDYIQTT